MTNRERIKYLRKWKKELEEDTKCNKEKIECLNYAIKQCDKNESKREAKSRNEY